MDREEESRKRKQRPSPGSDSGEEAARQNPGQRNTDRQHGSGSSPQFNLGNIPHRPAQQPAQEEIPDAPSGVAAESSGQRVKQRLFVGEGNFSASLAMAKKHPDTAQGIHATSYEPENHELFKEGSEAAANIQELRKMGAKISHGIDATKLKQYHGEESKLGTEKFDKAYFHHPRGKRKGKSAKKLSHSFAKSALDVLTDEGKIHLSIPSSKTYEQGNEQGNEQGKVQTAAHTRNSRYGGKFVRDTQDLGYKLQEKRKGIKERYGSQGFSHTITGKAESHDNLVSNEYVFQRSDNKGEKSPKEYSEIDTGSGTESTGSEEKRKEEMEQ
ncbi:DUF2431 domain-containing protein [Nostocaceae cyanobacterium CENA369]|uniref:DUF2431 domain-containing protein n=1 Tax=Dendronalium phyllosphericum CENA369 TaxID=1725256 RepID=A0A8J7LDV3_9NOST|nr:Rossmann-like fold-containing protein [Dendronalium phyllosphericum]MBH8572104.1 DUF2431 domain-containing protein [Dendronalium phyllosphericum CENA369]